MTHYRFETRWRLAAPLEEVYQALCQPSQWPTWWPGLVAVEPLGDGQASGIGRRFRYTWRSRLGYRLRFEVRVTRVQARRLIEAEAHGDVEGLGRWEFTERGAATEVRYLWQVKTTARWMNLLAPLARPLFAWNHHAMMRNGANGLARHLGATLLENRHGPA